MSTSEFPSCDGVILLAHGARDARWTEPFLRMHAALALRLSPRPVALSFLEFSPPSFAEATQTLRAQRVRSVLVVPVFLSGGGHVARDISPLIEAEQQRDPTMVFHVTGALGEEPEVAQAMLEAVTRLATE